VASRVVSGGDNPFNPPPELRDPARRLRGRLVSPVTVWTSATVRDEPAAITVSSLLVAEGDTPAVLGLIDPLSDFWSAVQQSKRFVVHVLLEEHRKLSEVFAGRHPGPGSKFDGLAFELTPRGPVLGDIRTRAFCSLGGVLDVGDALLVRGDIDGHELSAAATSPLAYFRGAYYGLRPPRVRGRGTPR
jgi:3-hydroxy-9,10-secoandrosta-1,3,5(10)-triene-9,17-dione monooxygenase reductase component